MKQKSVLLKFHVEGNFTGLVDIFGLESGSVSSLDRTEEGRQATQERIDMQGS